MAASLKLRPADPYGIQRVLAPKGALPQQAECVDPSLPIARDELLVEVESLNIDSASFHQISEECAKDPAKIGARIEAIVRERGKQHNPVTGSGGMLIGKVLEVGPDFPVGQKPVKIGDRIATLVSLTLTPLTIKKIKAVHPKIDRVDIEGHAILFASGIFARLPQDLPEAVALAVLDVAGAPAQTRRLVDAGQIVVIIGGGGKSGMLCLAEARRKPGVTLIAIEPSVAAGERLKKMGLADEVLAVDARQGPAVREAVLKATGGKLADLVINVANVPDTEMASILSCRSGGVVYFFSMATSFTRAALGAEGVGADIDLRIGNGYTAGHADLALELLRQTPALKDYFTKTYG